MHTHNFTKKVTLLRTHSLNDYTLTSLKFKPMLVPYATFLSVFMLGYLFSNCKIKAKMHKYNTWIVHTVTLLVHLQKREENIPLRLLSVQLTF